MPIQNLLHITPDKLFEEHTISEIIETQKRLQSEIERKREDLRTMVGERYRDLIEAADTIGEMKQTAEGIISHINNMSSRCQELQQKHLLGFKTESENCKSERLSKNKGYYSIAVQVKILLDIPEQIWTAIEEEDYILSAQLFLLARHINTGLHLGTEELNATKVVQYFPIIVRQWSSISHFHNAITSGCEKLLQLHTLTPQDASNCLSTLVLLEGLGSLELLKKFLALRTQALQQELQSDSHESVKKRIGNSVRLLVHTVSLLHACFLDGCPDSSQPEGLVWKQLKSIVGHDAPPAINLIDLQNCMAAKFLPPLVQDFRPSAAKPVEPVSPGEMRESLSRWLDWVRNYVQKEVSMLLGLVGSVKGLHAVREEAAELATPGGNWDIMCQRLFIPRGLNIWETYFQPHLTERAKCIVSQHWSNALGQLQAALSKSLQEISSDNCSQPEHDLRWFIWKEWNSDILQADKKDQPQQQAKGLLMKTKGYSPCIERLCAELDTQLEALLQDLKHYLELNPKESNKIKDRNELQQHLQSCSTSSIKSLMEFTKSVCKADPAADDKHYEARVILIARFLQALCDLCPNLHRCVTFTHNSKNDIGMQQWDSTLWQELCSLLKQESLEAWQLWQDSICSRLHHLAKSKLQLPQHLSSMLRSFPQWDVVSIEEQADEGKSIKSDIRVPSQPSLPLQSLLTMMAQQINAFAPHTLPRKIHQDLMESLVDDIYNHYKEISENENVTQAQALQFLLDVKYITLLLVPRDNKTLMGKSQEISDKFEDRVDPFDLDVFCPYIQSNIKRSVQRTQGLLGVLIAWPEKLAVMSGLKATGGSSIASNTGEDPNVLALSTNVPWFSLLPVTGPPGSRPPSSSTPQTLGDKPQHKKSTSIKPKSDQSPGELVRSGAAAFFGAMSTDWFGSS